MNRFLKTNFLAVLGVLLAAIVALGGAVLLGKFYLALVREGSVPKSTRVLSDPSKSVVAQREQEMVFLTPIPVYFLQAGVYTDLEGAQDAAKPFVDLGYSPYITQASPYKIWIGVYQKRGDTEFTKQQLKDKGYGSFTGSLVVNGSNLRYSKGSEPFIKEITPVLDTYTKWLKECLPLFAADHIDRLNCPLLEQDVPVFEQVYQEIVNPKDDLSTNNQKINEGFENLRLSVEEFHVQLSNLKKNRQQSNYAAIQRQLLEFIDKYQLLWQEIDNISKT